MTTLPKVDTYPLARGVIDSVRLNLCHFIWKKSFPWVVHPSVSLDGRKDLRIADVGCGTGSAHIIALLQHYFERHTLTSHQ